MSCTDENTCTRCKTGYWGLQCENECPLDCVGCDERGYCTAGNVTTVVPTKSDSSVIFGYDCKVKHLPVHST